MQQVTLNLLSNALKFTRTGGTIEVGSEIIDRGNARFIQVHVKDNGMGIS
jgi:signal transduction histidine kinase